MCIFFFFLKATHQDLWLYRSFENNNEAEDKQQMKAEPAEQVAEVPSGEGGSWDKR